MAADDSTTTAPSAEPPGAEDDSQNAGTKREVLALGAYLTTLSLVLLVLIYFLWPTAGHLGLATAGDAPGKPSAGSAGGPPASDDESGRGRAASPPASTTTPPAPPTTPVSAAPEGEGEGADASLPAAGAPPPPEVTDAASTSTADAEEPNLVPLLAQPLPPSRRILLLVMIVGMLGSVIGAATSFAGYVGNQTFKGSWVWWYILRPLLGSMLALMLYFVAQAGFLTTPTEAIDQMTSGRDRGSLESLFYAAMAIAGLAGMFSKLTSDKLESIFAVLLQSGADETRRNKMKQGQDDESEAGSS